MGITGQPLTSDPFATLGLLLALVAVGWGFGSAAAMARCSFGWISLGPRVRLIGIVLAVVLALGTTYAYALVLDATGFIDYCDPLYSAFHSC